MMSEQYAVHIFGYGSLISVSSISRTLSREVMARDLMPATLHGYQRDWGIAIPVIFDDGGGSQQTELGLVAGAAVVRFCAADLAAGLVAVRFFVAGLVAGAAAARPFAFGRVVVVFFTVVRGRAAIAFFAMYVLLLPRGRAAVATSKYVIGRGSNRFRPVVVLAARVRNLSRKSVGCRIGWRERHRREPGLPRRILRT